MRWGVEIIENTRLIVRLKAKTSYLSKKKSSTTSELIPKNSSHLNIKFNIIFLRFACILTLKWDEFFGMSSDVVELFFFDKYDVLAFKRTIKRAFSIIYTPRLISNMLVR